MEVLNSNNSEAIFGKRPPNVPEFRFLTDIPKGESETILLYGGSGTGKTWIGGTAGDRALFINNGNGRSTLQSPLFRKNINSNPIIVDLYESLKGGVFDVARVHDAICDTIDHALQNFPDKFDFVIVDDATQLRRGAMNKGLEISSEMGGKSKTLESVRKFDVIVPAVQDFGMEMSIVEQFVASYTTICKEAGKHFILSAHERLTYKKGERIGDAPSLIKVSPGFTGQTFPDAIPAYFDNVWYTQVVGGGNARVYRVTTQGTESLIAKTRMAGVFETIEKDMNLLNAIKRIRESNPKNIKR